MIMKLFIKNLGQQKHVKSCSLTILRFFPRMTPREKKNQYFGKKNFSLPLVLNNFL